MKNKIILMITLAVFGTMLAGCSASVGTSKSGETNSKPANMNAEKKDKDSTKKDDSKKTPVKDEKRPDGEAKTAKKENPVPDDWDYYYNESKGYGFYVPEGSEVEQMVENGQEIAGITTPTDIDLYVIAYKDQKLSKEDLLNYAADFLEANGHEKVTPGAIKSESDVYSVADATSVMEDGTDVKLRILVGTDITDNYLMIIGTESKDFAANEKIIDEIWGSFEIWSGGGVSK